MPNKLEYKLNGSRIEVEWKLPNGSAHVSIMELHGTQTSMRPAVTSIYCARRSFHPLLCANMTFIYFPRLPVFPMSFQCFHFSSTFTESAIYVRRNFHSLSCAPIYSLETTSAPFNFFSIKLPVPPFSFYFHGNFHLRPQKTPFYSHPTTFDRSTISDRLRFALRAHGLRIVFLHLVGASKVPNEITSGWDQVRVEYGSRQMLLRTPMEVSLKVEVEEKLCHGGP